MKFINDEGHILTLKTIPGMMFEIYLEKLHALGEALEGKELGDGNPKYQVIIDATRPAIRALSQRLYDFKVGKYIQRDGSYKRVDGPVTRKLSNGDLVTKV